MEEEEESSGRRSDGGTSPPNGTTARKPRHSFNVERTVFARQDPYGPELEQAIGCRLWCAMTDGTCVNQSADQQFRTAVEFSRRAF